MAHKLHIWKKSTDKKAVCGNTNKDYALYVDEYWGGYKWLNFLYNCFTRKRNRCDHCENRATKEMVKEQEASNESK